MEFIAGPDDPVLGIYWHHLGNSGTLSKTHHIISRVLFRTWHTHSYYRWWRFKLVQNKIQHIIYIKMVKAETSCDFRIHRLTPFFRPDFKSAKSELNTQRGRIKNIQIKSCICKHYIHTFSSTWWQEWPWWTTIVCSVCFTRLVLPREDRKWSWPTLALSRATPR